MSTIEVVPFLVAALLGLTGTRLGRSLPPATAVRLLTLAAVVTALATGVVLSAVALTVLGQTPVLAARGHWSVALLHRSMPVPVAAGLLPAALVLVLLLAAVRRSAGVVRDLAAAERICRGLGPATAGLVVVQDDQPAAYTVPGVTGRIVISTAMLRALPAAERGVLLAHENSHLRHRHHLYRQSADVAAAANPLLRPVAVAVARAIERWADEDAATTTGDRRLAARALARAGLAGARASRTRMPVAALGAVDDVVVERVRALLGPAPAKRRALSLAVAVLTIASAGAAGRTAQATDHGFDRAHIVTVTQG